MAEGHRRVAQKLVAVLLFVAFVACFLLQVREQVIKFLGKETVTVTRDAPDENLKFPVVTVCLLKGYKSELITQANGRTTALPYSNMESPGNWTKERANGMWNSITFSLHEMLEAVSLFADGSPHTISDFSHGGGSLNITTSAGTSGALKISELGSFEFGKCAIIESDIVITDTDTHWLDISSKLSPMIIFLSEDGPNELGVAVNHWGKWPFKMIRVESNTATVAAMEKTVEESDSQIVSCSQSTTSRSTTNCYRDTIQDTLEADVNCFMPQLKEITGDFSTCSGPEKATVTHDKIHKEKVTIAARGKCGAPCSLEVFGISIRERLLEPLSDVSSNGSFFGMYFTSNVVHNTRQLVLYDLSTIVAAVGGSMGMFLGFSCLQFFRQCLDWIMDSFPNSKN